MLSIRSISQVDVWTPDCIDADEWDKTLSDHHAFVEVNDSDIIIGCGDIDDSGYPCITIITHASITAKPFFEKRGYKVAKEQLVEEMAYF